MRYIYIYFILLIRSLLKVTKVTTEHQKRPKLGVNSILSPFFARRVSKASSECQSSLQELEKGPRSGPYLLVLVTLAVQPLDLETMYKVQAKILLRSESKPFRLLSSLNTIYRMYRLQSTHLLRINVNKTGAITFCREKPFWLDIWWWHVLAPPVSTPVATRPPQARQEPVGADQA